MSGTGLPPHDPVPPWARKLMELQRLATEKLGPIARPVAQHPLPVLAVLGLLAAFGLAQWTDRIVSATAPVVRTSADDRTAPPAGLHWAPTDAELALAFGDGSVSLAKPDGSFSRNVSELDILREPDGGSARQAVAHVVAARSRIPVQDGMLLLRGGREDIVTPGGLSTVDGDGMVLVTGAALIRNRNGTEGRIVLTGPDPRSVWRVGAEGSPGRQARGSRFQVAFRSDAIVTAMVGMPGAGRAAIGTSDGRVSVVDRNTEIDARRPLAKGPDQHDGPVVALAVAGSVTPDDTNRAQLASAASDGSLKTWYRVGEALIPQSVTWPRDAAAVAVSPESLELSGLGDTLLVKAPSGALYAARLPAPGRSGSNRLRPVPLPTAASAATVTADGSRLFVAGTDCLIRELDISALLDGDDAEAPVVTILRGHGGPLTHLALSPDGAYLAAASLDRRVRIHRLASARTVAALPLADLPTGPACVATRPAGPGSLRRSGHRVFVQFAGSIDRAAMIAFSRALQASGWNVQGADQGGERVGSAAGTNEVRYGPPADRSLAEELAAEASARRTPRLSGPGLRAVAVPNITGGSLEIWLSR